MNASPSKTTKGAGISAAQFIEWHGGFGEQFHGTIFQAEARILSESCADTLGAVFTIDEEGREPRGEYGDILRKRTSCGVSLYEWRICPHGDDWHFLGRIFTK